MRTAFALASALAACAGAQAASLVANPALPGYGTRITMELQDSRPAYLPGTRYVRSGNTISIDFERAPASFGPARPDFGAASLDLGELAPGNYTVEARLFPAEAPDAAPEVIQQQLAVLPPERWGLYTVPQEPAAFEPTDAVIRSAAYFEPTSMQVTVNANVLRVDFDYRGDAPVGSPAPPGMSSFGAARLPPLAPGDYILEGWGHDKSTGVTERYFVTPFRVAKAAHVVEYYAASTGHFFMAAAADETALLDSGATGGWKRTGQAFHAWLRQGDAPPDAKPVCRFYALGPNSHFYTADPRECEFLKSLEQDQRAEARAAGRPFLGWGYEGIAFFALVPVNGQCSAGTTPVWRAYNDRAVENDSNHRFTSEPEQRIATAISWIEEGVAFCSPPR